jgi:hypothetical protein
MVAQGNERLVRKETRKKLEVSILKKQRKLNNFKEIMLKKRDARLKLKRNSLIKMKKELFQRIARIESAIQTKKATKDAKIKLASPKKRQMRKNTKNKELSSSSDEEMIKNKTPKS